LQSIYLRFGKASTFDYLRSFIISGSNCELICSNGFLIFEDFCSASERLSNSNYQWVIIPDPEFGFYLLINFNHSIGSHQFFLLRTKSQLDFYILDDHNLIFIW
jgi:hypothetical protein